MMELHQVTVTDNQVDNSNIVNTPKDKPSSTLLTKSWMPVSDNPRYGIWPLFLGTLKVTIIALLFAAPLSILAAVYTSMFAKARAQGNNKACYRTSGRISFRCDRFFCPDGHGDCISGNVWIFKQIKWICRRNCHGTCSNSDNLYSY